MTRPARLLRIGVMVLILAMVSGLLLEPAMRPASNPEYDAGNWAVSLLWLAAAIILVASVVTAAMTVMGVPGGRNRLSFVAMSPATRVALAFAASWLCSLPHAYLAMPHFRATLPLYIAGLEAYAVGNAVVSFVVCAIVLALFRRRADGGIKAALVVAVLVNAAFVQMYLDLPHSPG